MVNRRRFVSGLATTASGYGLYAWALPTEAQSKASREDDPVLTLVVDEQVRIAKKIRKARRAAKVDHYDMAAAMRMAASRVRTLGRDELVKQQMARIDPNSWYAPPTPTGPGVLARMKKKGIEDDGLLLPEPSDIVLNVEMARKIGKVGVSPALNFFARAFGELAEQVGKPERPRPAGFQAVAYLPVDWSDDYWCNISSACDASGAGGGGGGQGTGCRTMQVLLAEAGALLMVLQRLARETPPGPLQAEIAILIAGTEITIGTLSFAIAFNC